MLFLTTSLRLLQTPPANGFSIQPENDFRLDAGEFTNLILRYHNQHQTYHQTNYICAFAKNYNQPIHTIQSSVIATPLPVFVLSNYGDYENSVFHQAQSFTQLDTQLSDTQQDTSNLDKYFSKFQVTNENEVAEIPAEISESNPIYFELNFVLDMNDKTSSGVSRSSQLSAIAETEDVAADETLSTRRSKTKFVEKSITFNLGIATSGTNPLVEELENYTSKNSDGKTNKNSKPAGKLGKDAKKGGSNSGAEFTFSENPIYDNLLELKNIDNAFTRLGLSFSDTKISVAEASSNPQNLVKLTWRPKEYSTTDFEKYQTMLESRTTSQAASARPSKTNAKKKDAKAVTKKSSGKRLSTTSAINVVTGPVDWSQEQKITFGIECKHENRRYVWNCHLTLKNF